MVELSGYVEGGKLDVLALGRMDGATLVVASPDRGATLRHDRLAKLSGLVPQATH